MTIMWRLYGCPAVGFVVCRGDYMQAFLSFPFLSFSYRDAFFFFKSRLLCYKFPARKLSVSSQLICVITRKVKSRRVVLGIFPFWEHRNSLCTHLVKTFLLYLPCQNLSQVAYNIPRSRYSTPWTRELSDYDYSNYSEPSFICTDIDV